MILGINTDCKQVVLETVVRRRLARRYCDGRDAARRSVRRCRRELTNRLCREARKAPAACLPRVSRKRKASTRGITRPPPQFIRSQILRNSTRGLPRSGNQLYSRTLNAKVRNKQNFGGYGGLLLRKLIDQVNGRARRRGQAGSGRARAGGDFLLDVEGGLAGRHSAAAVL